MGEEFSQNKVEKEEINLWFLTIPRNAVVMFGIGFFFLLASFATWQDLRWFPIPELFNRDSSGAIVLGALGLCFSLPLLVHRHKSIKANR